MMKIGGLFAFFVTICKVITQFAVVPIVGFIAAHSSFFYGLAVGIMVAGLTRNLWLILIAIAAVFILLVYVGF